MMFVMVANVPTEVVHGPIIAASLLPVVEENVML